MKKAVIPVSFDAEKLSAARLYMAQKDLSFEEEMEKAADALDQGHPVIPGITAAAVADADLPFIRHGASSGWSGPRPAAPG